MTTVEFVYEKSCPNVRRARVRLIEAFRNAGLVPKWTEWETGDSNTPESRRKWGSPTILVDGADVAGFGADEAGDCCRIYGSQGEDRGVPPLDAIVAALRTGNEREAANDSGIVAGPTGAFGLNAAVLPSVGAALLPKLTCPACWPAYAGVLSSLGVGFIDYTPYLLPLTAVFLALSVVALVYRARSRRGYGPFLLGLLAATTVLFGKFGFDNDSMMYAGLGGLVVASLWNSWKRPTTARNGLVACPACIPEKI